MLSSMLSALYPQSPAGPSKASQNSGATIASLVFSPIVSTQARLISVASSLAVSRPPIIASSRRASNKLGASDARSVSLARLRIARPQ